MHRCSHLHDLRQATYGTSLHPLQSSSSFLSNQRWILRHPCSQYHAQHDRLLPYHDLRLRIRLRLASRTACRCHALALGCTSLKLLLAQESSSPTARRLPMLSMLNLGLLASRHLGSRTQKEVHELPSQPTLTILRRLPCHICS